MAERPAPSDAERFLPEAATPTWRRRAKASEVGRVAAAMYRRRRMLRQLAAAPGGLRSGRAPAPAERQKVRLVCWMPAGPGARAALLDTYASAVASAAPGEIGLLVTDDWTPDCDAASIQAAVPGAVVVRTRVPSGGPPRLWPVTALAIRAALQHFEFDYLVKLDTDALIVGPGFAAGIDTAMRHAADQASARILEYPVGRSGPLAPLQSVEAGPARAPRPAVGIAGAFRERPDGATELDEPYHRRVLAGELPRDRRLADWRRRALEGGWPDGSIVQGGCLVLTHACCTAIAAEGALRYRPRLRTIVSEDLLLTILAYATGFRAHSLGGPDGPLAIANKHLPLPLEELLEPGSRWLVAHSTKVGLAGEAESEIRDRAQRARQRW